MHAITLISSTGCVIHWGFTVAACQRDSLIRRRIKLRAPPSSGARCTLTVHTRSTDVVSPCGAQTRICGAILFPLPLPLPPWIMLRSLDNLTGAPCSSTNAINAFPRYRQARDERTEREDACYDFITLL